ncbi:MAG: hypothetical protein HY690_11285 [Chloroflexi bacterium]|nr:hypothetical protein [Chloroflexota bacterium]
MDSDSGYDRLQALLAATRGPWTAEGEACPPEPVLREYFERFLRRGRGTRLPAELEVVRRHAYRCERCFGTLRAWLADEAQDRVWRETNAVEAQRYDADALLRTARDLARPEYVRVAAVQTLKHLPCADVQRGLRQLAAYDPEEEVREAAEEALATVSATLEAAACWIEGAGRSLWVLPVGDLPVEGRLAALGAEVRVSQGEMATAGAPVTLEGRTADGRLRWQVLLLGRLQDAVRLWVRSDDPALEDKRVSLVYGLVGEAEPRFSDWLTLRQVGKREYGGWRDLGRLAEIGFSESSRVLLLIEDGGGWLEGGG